MQLNKKALRENRRRADGKGAGKGVKKPPTRRQLNAKKAQALLKAEKIAVKNAAWEVSKKDAKDAQKLAFQKAVGRSLARETLKERAALVKWEVKTYGMVFFG